MTRTTSGVMLATMLFLASCGGSGVSLSPEAERLQPRVPESWRLLGEYSTPRVDDGEPESPHPAVRYSYRQDVSTDGATEAVVFVVCLAAETSGPCPPAEQLGDGRDSEAAPRIAPLAEIDPQGLTVHASVDHVVIYCNSLTCDETDLNRLEDEWASIA